MIKHRLLIVEDEEAMRCLLETTLEDPSRYEILTAADGVEALKQARSLRPRLILLDILLPGLDGLEVCRQLKSDPTTSDIKIVMVTALAEETDRRRAMSAGADTYVTKPFSPTQLVEIVKRVMGGELGLETGRDT